MYEMLRNVLDIMQRNKNIKGRLDENYKRRALEDHLKNVPLFASLTPDFIDSLRDRVELVRFEAGDVICRQGDVADSFYLIRIGFVKVAEDHPQGELVLNYLTRSGCWQVGLLGMGAGAAAVQPRARRSITWKWSASEPRISSAWWILSPKSAAVWKRSRQAPGTKSPSA